MTRDELAAKIRKRIQKSPMGEMIQLGYVHSMCKNFSRKTYALLTDKRTAIPGLSVAIVTNLNYHADADHAWLVAHHPDTGYFMIDPTLGQFVQDKQGESYKDVFIGTYNDLEKMVSSGQYQTIRGRSVESLWSPAMRFHEGSSDPADDDTPGMFCNPGDIARLWDRYEFPVIPLSMADSNAMSDARMFGLWAARMEEAGIGWQPALKKLYDEDGFLKPRNPDEAHFFAQVKNHRNQYIKLGADKHGNAYQPMMGEGYAARKTVLYHGTQQMKKFLGRDVNPPPHKPKDGEEYYGLQRPGLFVFTGEAAAKYAFDPNNPDSNYQPANPSPAAVVGVEPKDIKNWRPDYEVHGVQVLREAKHYYYNGKSLNRFLLGKSINLLNKTYRVTIADDHCIQFHITGDGRNTRKAINPERLDANDYMIRDADLVQAVMDIIERDAPQEFESINGGLVAQLMSQKNAALKYVGDEPQPIVSRSIHTDGKWQEFQPLRHASQMRAAATEQGRLSGKT